LLGARLNDTNNKGIAPNATEKAIDDNYIAFGVPEQEISGSSTIPHARPPPTERDETSGKKTILRPRLAPISED
jgi:hypothetical protein